jgi:oxygen-dependent protoporphyrinogen oxidase
MADHDVVVIGGGISGLSFAFRCAGAGLDARVLERSPNAGGCIHSERLDTGFWLEMGAHTCYNSYGGTLEMIDACGLSDRITPRAKVPFRLLRDGELRSIPSELSIWEILRSAPRILFAQKDGHSIESYYSRLVGPGNFRRVLSPMLAAVPSQNADAFPATMLFKKRPRRKDVLRSFTLAGGLRTLVEGLVEQSRFEKVPQQDRCASRPVEIDHRF